MSAGANMLDQVSGHGLYVFREQDVVLALTPKQDFWIVTAEGQIGGIADTHSIDRQAAQSSMPVNGHP